MVREIMRKLKIAFCCQILDICFAFRRPGSGFRNSAWVEMTADIFALCDQSEQEGAGGEWENWERKDGMDDIQSGWQSAKLHSWRGRERGIRLSLLSRHDTPWTVRMRSQWGDKVEVWSKIQHHILNYWVPIMCYRSLNFLKSLIKIAFDIVMLKS